MSEKPVTGRGKKSEAEKARILERQNRALALRKTAMSYRAIAKQLETEGFGPISHVQVGKDIQTALKSAARQNNLEANELRVLELERLDTALMAIYSNVVKGDVKAVAEWRKLSESRRKLMGLDAPTITIQYEAQLIQVINALKQKGFDPSETFNAMLEQLAHVTGNNKDTP